MERQSSSWPSTSRAKLPIATARYDCRVVMDGECVDFWRRVLV